jgi:hypothetical protein
VLVMPAQNEREAHSIFGCEQADTLNVSKNP